MQRGRKDSQSPVEMDPRLAALIAKLPEVPRKATPAEAAAIAAELKARIADGRLGEQLARDFADIAA